MIWALDSVTSTFSKDTSCFGISTVFIVFFFFLLNPVYSTTLLHKTVQNGIKIKQHQSSVLRCTWHIHNRPTRCFQSRFQNKIPCCCTNTCAIPVYEHKCFKYHLQSSCFMRASPVSQQTKCVLCSSKFDFGFQGAATNVTEGAASGRHLANQRETKHVMRSRNADEWLLSVS